MALILYSAFLALACVHAMQNWRRAWYAVVICGIVQDPVRKLTPGQPVAVSFLVVGLFLVILFSARNELRSAVIESSRRFPNLYTALLTFLCVLLIAALNGLMTYGWQYWKVPLVSFVTYVAPLTAILFGYVWLQREEMMFRFFSFYAVLTSVTMIGVVLEYFRVQSSIIGAVSLIGDNIRHLPGIQIRMLSGFYRSPDIMALHAATVTAIAVMMALRTGIKKQLVFWYGVGGFGFLVCIMSGRRKALYFAAVFCVAFVWRYLKRANMSQLFALAGIALLVGFVITNISSNEQTSVYTRGATASQGEFMQRLEGGTMETFRQFGLLGAGLGTATQGVRHLLGTDVNIGWQEGGIAKLAIEVGLPGILAILALGWVVMRLWLRLTAIGDVEGSSQFIRVALFAFVAANGASYMASAQAYSDAVLALMAGFLAGCLLATAVLDERYAAMKGVASPAPAATAPALRPSSLPATS